MTDAEYLDWVAKLLAPEHATRVRGIAATLLSASKPAAPHGMKVTEQGIQFGNAWYSHEKITGYTAEQLNAGDCRVTGRAYVAWLQETLAASPQATATQPALTDAQIDAIKYARSVMGSVSWETSDSKRVKEVLDALLTAAKSASGGDSGNNS